MKKEYLILLIVIIVGLVAIFSLAFLTAGDYDLTGAWGGGGSCDCGGNQACVDCCSKKDCTSARSICEGCFGTWGSGGGGDSGMEYPEL